MKIFVILLTIAAVALIGAFFITMPNSPSVPAKSEISIGDAVLTVEVVSSPEERQRGLSGREALPEGNGMLFVFEEEGSWGIWMKDMQFPIDILWARSDGTITTIEEHVSPETYPKNFFPKTPDAKYVLEAKAGFVNTHSIAEGMEIVVQY